MSVDELKDYLEDKSHILDDRMKVLVTAQGLSLSAKAYLGQVLLETITPQEETALKGKVIQLRVRVSDWQDKALNAF